MRKINMVFFALLIIAISLPICVFVYEYIPSKYYVNLDGKALYPNLHSVDDSTKFEYIDKYESLDDVKEYISLAPLKEYKSDAEIYLLVFEGWGSENGLVCYRYKSDTKELYKVVAENSLLGTLYYKNIQDADWYDEGTIFDLMHASIGSGHFIPQGSSESGEIGDVYYGIWYGDEVKNISFEKGKFDYLLIDGYEGNAYLCTYELKDSTELFKQVITEDEEGFMYDTKDVKELLGVKCKYTFDRRIIIYLIITAMLSILAILSISKTFMLNQKVSVISMQQILFWLISIVLCAVVALLIINFIYNPRLVYGLQTVRLVEKIFGITIPNNPATL